MENLSPLNVDGSRSRRALMERRAAEFSRPHDNEPLYTPESYTRLLGNGGDGRDPQYTSISGQPQGDQHDARKAASRNSRVDRFWLWEFLSLSIATIAVAAIVITLMLHKDRPLPEWPSLITLNSLVAVFSAILKASLTLPISECISQLKWLWFRKLRPIEHMDRWDLASRGPWGSLLLIFKLKYRDLAVLGAFLMVAAMAIDPFTQQIVRYYSCLVMAEGVHSSIPFSNNYTDGRLAIRSGSPELDSQMHAAIYIGLLNPPANVSAALPFTCQTGNCTFPSTEEGAAFMTLALESKCVDITPKVHYSYTWQNITSKVVISASLADYNIFLTNGTSSLYEVMQSGHKYFEDSPSPYLDKVAFLMWTTERLRNPIRAFECEFYPVVDTYSANVTNGVLVEHLLDSQRMEVWPAPRGEFALLRVNRTIREGNWEECKSAANSSEEYSIAITENTDSPFPFVSTQAQVSPTVAGTMWWRPPCVYYISNPPTIGLANAIRHSLGKETVYYSLTTLTGQGNLWSVNLWKDGNATLDTVQTAMTGLGNAITARWRQGDGISTNSGPIVGSTLRNQTCVRVQWYWILLPASLLFLTSIFLVLTIVCTNLNNGLVWKSSMLPMLFAGLDANTRESAGMVMGLKEMTEAATATAVQLRETKDGFRLVGPNLKS